MARKHHRSDRRVIAIERIKNLFENAESFYHENPLWSNRCIQLARRIAMKERVRIPPDLSRRYCRRCSGYLVPGSSSLIRITRGRVVITCTGCGYRRRYPVHRRS